MSGRDQIKVQLHFSVIAGGFQETHDSELQENAAAMTLAFSNQAAPCIKRELQKLECLGEKKALEI